MVTSCHPFVFGVRDDGVAVDIDLVTGSVELDRCLGNDSSSLSADSKDLIAWAYIG